MPATVLKLPRSPSGALRDFVFCLPRNDTARAFVFTTRAQRACDGAGGSGCAGSAAAVDGYVRDEQFLPLLRLSGLMRVGTNLLTSVLLQNLSPRPYFLAQDPCRSRLEQDVLNPWHWKHASFVRGEAYHGDGYSASLRCAAGDDSVASCSSLQWPDVSATAMMGAFDSLLQCRPMHIVVTKGARGFVASLHSALESWRCAKVPRNRRAACLAVERSLGRGRNHTLAWNDFHAWWLGMWASSAVRVLWLSYEGFLADPRGALRRLLLSTGYQPTPTFHVPEAVSHTGSKDSFLEQQRKYANHSSVLLPSFAPDAGRRPPLATRDWSATRWLFETLFVLRGMLEGSSSSQSSSPIR